MRRGIIDRIKMEEGFRAKPYRCTSNKLTVGYGYNLDAGMSEEDATLLLKSKLDRDISWLCSKRNTMPFNYRRLPYNAREVLADMTYQLGRTGLKRFKKMLKAIGERDWTTAAKELMDSKYAKQTPNRAIRNRNLLLKCRWKRACICNKSAKK